MNSSLGLGTLIRSGAPQHPPYAMLPLPSPGSKAGQSPGAIRLSSIPEARRRTGQPKRSRAKINSSPYTNAPPASNLLSVLVQNKIPFGQGGISRVIKDHLGSQIKPSPRGGPNKATTKGWPINLLYTTSRVPLGAGQGDGNCRAPTTCDVGIMVPVSFTWWDNHDLPSPSLEPALPAFTESLNN